MIKYIEDVIMKWLGVSDFYTPNSNLYADLILFGIGLVIVYGLVLLCRWLVSFVARKLSSKTVNKVDDYLLERKFFTRVAYIPGLILLDILVDLLFATHPQTHHLLKVTLGILSVINICALFFSVLNAMEDAHTRRDARRGSIRGIVQALKTTTYVVATIFILSLILGVKIGTLLTALGAASAILMLVFKDSILGLVGGIQLSMNKVVLPGDWIEMPSAGADGNVLEISQVTVKVQNWDNTIVTIPTYDLISKPVKNWRGMSESGVRRIKRSIFIDMTSVKFCTDEMLERYAGIEYVAGYVKEKQKEIDEDNAARRINGELEVNGRQQTNIGVFRAYLQRYLENHPGLSRDFTLMARQLQPTEAGIPIEIYVFTKTTAWVEYEGIQSDIFDHIIAAVPYFDLRVYQSPSWNDYRLFQSATPGEPLK